MAYSPLHKNGDVLRHPAIRSAANAHGVSTSKVTLRWITQKGVPLISVLASKPKHQAKTEASRSTFELSDAQMAAIDSIRDAAHAPRAWGGDPNEIP